MKERNITEAADSVDRHSPSAIQCDHLDNLILVISRAFSFFLLHKHFINKKQNSFSGDVNYVIYIAGERKMFLFIYEVFGKQKKKGKRSANHHS
jgi:hypothetical protein